MTMYDEDESKGNYKKLSVSCKNCDKHIHYLIRPINIQLLGDIFCNEKCISQYEEKQHKIKENLTEHTLK